MTVQIPGFNSGDTIYIGKVPEERKHELGHKRDSYYKLSVYASQNGCPLFPDAIPVIQALNIPHFLHEPGADVACAGEIGRVQWVWYSHASKKEYDEYRKNPIGERAITNRMAIGFLSRE